MTISISVGTVNVNVDAKTYSPGTSSRSSVAPSDTGRFCLKAGRWRGLVNAVHQLFGGEILIALTSSLVVVSALLVPLAAAATCLIYGAHVLREERKREGPRLANGWRASRCRILIQGQDVRDSPVTTLMA
ncbi:hypothetical protein DL767_004859 [Monosporascus sp. MG133]|nr:hypothetical protein DL767_004859 [Monosporascus sp. MG133]